MTTNLQEQLVYCDQSRLDVYGGMSDDDRAELSKLLGVEVHHQGASVEPGTTSYRAWIARAEGKQVVA